MNIPVNFIPHPNGGVALTVGVPGYHNMSDVRPEACRFANESAAIDALCVSLKEQGLAYFAACDIVIR